MPLALLSSDPRAAPQLTMLRTARSSGPLATVAHLWIDDTHGEWAVLSLSSPRFVLAPSRGEALMAHSARDAMHDATVVLVRAGEGDRREWLLLAALDAAIWLNGLPLIGGLRVLRDRDEIRVAGNINCFFSTEELACVTPMPATETPIVCPRCRQRLELDSPAVRCPQCELWHHQSDVLPCWTYSPTCAMCPQSTALDAGFQWTPLAL